jgi:hypothetical protein
MDYIYDQLTQEYDAITYEAFINLLVWSILFSLCFDMSRKSCVGGHY